VRYGGALGKVLDDDDNLWALPIEFQRCRIQSRFAVLARHQPFNVRNDL
jgi:hypothetical protein